MFVQCSYYTIPGDVCLADVVFVLDSSGSIGPSDWEVALEFVVEVIEELDPFNNNIQIGCVTFGNGADVNFYLNGHDDLDDMIRDVLAIPYKNANTNTTAGIQTMHYDVFVEANGRRSNVPALGKLMLL